MKNGFIKFGLAALISIFLVACKSVDINDEAAIVRDIQGTWTGCEKVGDLYTHIKLNIMKDSFDGWVQVTDSETAPEWSIVPSESGTYTLNSVQEDPGKDMKFRKLTFSVAGRCCGDKSLAIESLQKEISYVDSKGLSMAGEKQMVKK